MSDAVIYPHDPDYGVLGPLPPGWVNVQDFGADPTGNDVASGFIQEAADAIPDDGGVLLLPPGIYKFDEVVRLKPKTKVMQHGATLRPVRYQDYTPLTDNATPGIGGYYVFANKNFSLDGTPDDGIEVWGGTFDYSDFGIVPGGGAHAIHFLNARNIKIGHGTLQAGEDYIACRACDDVLVIGCSAYDFGNCAWDFWWGCKNVRVIGCYSVSDFTVQHANFQCSQSVFPTGQVADNFIMQGCTMVHPLGGTPTYSSIFLDPFGTGNITQNVIIQGCQLHNVIIAARGDVRNTLIQGCQFFGGTSAVPPIFSYADAGNTPDGITVDSCTFTDYPTAPNSVAIIDVRGTNNRVTNNRIVGALHTVPTYSFGGNPGVAYGNTDPLGTFESTTTKIGDETIRSPNNRGFSIFDTQGTWSRLTVSDADELALFARTTAGLPRLAFSMAARSDTGVFNLWQESRFQSTMLRSVATALTATGTTRADAFQLASYWNDVTTVAAGTGVKLTTRSLGVYSTVIRNGGANALLVYPFDAAGQIDGLGLGNPYSLPAGRIGRWAMVANGQHYTESVSP